MRQSLRAAFAAFVVLSLALMLGCGSSSSSGNGIQGKSAAAILQATKAAAAKAVSVHIDGSIVSEGKPISLNMELLAGKGGKGTISQDGYTIKLIQVDEALYINGSAAFYEHVAGSAAAQLLQGRWLKAPANSGELASLSSLTNLGKLVDTALQGHSQLSKGATSTIAGRQAIALSDTAKGGTLYVATTGKPYPLEIAKAGKESGKVVLEAWDQPVTLSAPAGAIDISKLQGEG